MFVFLLSRENSIYSMVWLRFVCGSGGVVLWFFFFLPLALSVCVTFFSTGRGKSERVLLERTLLILLGTRSLGLRALEKLLLDQSSPVGNTPLCQRGSFWHWHIRACFSVPKKRTGSRDWLGAVWGPSLESREEA